MIQNDRSMAAKVECNEAKTAATEEGYAAPQLVAVGTAVELIQGQKCCHVLDGFNGWYVYGQWN